MTGNSTDSENAGSSEYFNLHTTGLGYLNRAREVPTRSKPFLAVDVVALRGPRNNVQRTRFDCIVHGRKAKELVRRLMPDIEGGRKVLVEFRLGDLYAAPFLYTTEERAGEPGASLKARLLKIVWARVEGETVYSERAEKTESRRQTRGSDARESALATARRAAGAR